MENINSRVGIGIVWMVGARLFDRCIGIVSTLILARLLVPADFGLVAMATAIVAILDLLGAFSFDMALIQNKDAGRKQYDTVWTFNVIFGVSCGLLLIALAGPAAGFYKEPRLTAVMYVLSLSYFLYAFTNVGLVQFRKELDFNKEFYYIFQRRVVTFLITISAAYLLRSYWALLLGMTAGRIVFEPALDRTGRPDQPRDVSRLFENARRRTNCPGLPEAVRTHYPDHPADRHRHRGGGLAAGGDGTGRALAGCHSRDPAVGHPRRHQRYARQ